MVQCVEDGTNRNHSVSGKQKPRAMTFRSVFSLEHIKNSFGVVFKPREDGSRHFIVLLVASFAIYTYANTGTILINLPYAKQQFIWAGDIRKTLQLTSNTVYQAFFCNTGRPKD